jgi:cytochrome c oxidase subunit 4
MNQENHSNGDRHVVTYGHSILIWLGLLSLTGLTVALAGIGFGRWVIATALVIAGVKSTLVLNHFMHLKHEERMFRWFVAVSMTTLGIFFVLTFFDYAFH